MRSILLATDGSPSASKAADAAIELAQATGSPLHVVTAWSIPAAAFGLAPMTLVPELGEAERTRAADVLAAARARAEAAGLEVEATLREGIAVEQICEAARELDASLVVVGAHGWGPLRRLVFGSVSTGVLHHAPCPVLVVRGEAEGGEQEPVEADAAAV